MNFEMPSEANLLRFTMLKCDNEGVDHQSEYSFAGTPMNAKYFQSALVYL